MKQHITVEQLNELSGKTQKTWWGFIIGDQNYHNGSEMTIAKKSTIGMMIEFLEERGYGIMIDKMRKNKKWIVDIDKPMKYIEGKELCDALWEAIKEVLEK